MRYINPHYLLTYLQAATVVLHPGEVKNAKKQLVLAS